MAGYDYDLFTIGAGSGGVRASRMSASFGARVAVCEAGPVGGTCVNVGCVPKKLMVYASHFREDFENAVGFGFDKVEPSFSWPTLIDRKNKEILRLNGIYESLLQRAGVTLMRGRAHLVDAHTVAIGDQRFTAQHILVAVGSQPVRPTFPGNEHAWVSDDMFRLAEQPRRFLVMGGGYIAIEFACVMRGLGSEVTLVHRSPHLLRGFDDDARAFVTREVQKKGIRVITNATVDALEKRSTGLVATLSNGDTIEVDGALSAIGRLPKTASLGLDNAGVRVDDVGAIVVDDYGHTNVPSVHAIGDVTNRLNLTPVAIAEGTALARTLFNGTKTAAHREDVPTAVFSSPPLSCVGLTEARAREFGPVDIYTSEFRPMKHTMSGSDERSFMKLVVDQATQRVLGAHMVGADAPEIIQGIAIAITCRATKAQFDATIGIHPTAAEEFVTMRDKR